MSVLDETATPAAPRELFGLDHPDARSRPVALVPSACVRLDDSTAVYDEDDRVLVILNKSASEIWERCDGASSLGEIAAALALAHGAPEEDVRTDVWLTLRRLANLGLVSAAHEAQQSESAV